jgi:hypothetical protein
MASHLNPFRKLGQAKILSTTPKKPVSGPVLGTTGEKVSKDILAFQFWPESLSDTKSVEYARKTVLGSSHPLYQFVNSGERELAFTAIFSRDVNPMPQIVQNGRGQTSTPTVEADKYNVDINAAVWALRRFLYPSYGESDLKAFPPEVIQLQLDNTAIGGYNKNGAVDIMSCIMGHCNVTYHAWFPDGTPRHATVDLSFFETVQSDPAEPADIRYVDRMSFASAWTKFAQKQGTLPKAPSSGPDKNG